MKRAIVQKNEIPTFEYFFMKLYAVYDSITHFPQKQLFTHEKIV